MHIAKFSEIETEAAALRTSWTSFQDLERLDLLDRIMERYRENPKKETTGYSKSPARETSEFALLAGSVPMETLISVLDEHMAVLQMIYPKDYDAIMRKLRDY